jgi:hypothetical protein
MWDILESHLAVRDLFIEPGVDEYLKKWKEDIQGRG